MTVKNYGGARENSGRHTLPPDKKKKTRAVCLEPDLDKWLIDQVGDGRGAVSREIERILQMHRKGA